MFDIERTPIQETISRMAQLIDGVTAANQAIVGPSVDDITPFHSRTVPAISVRDYLLRVAKFVCLENDTLISILIYLDRITQAQTHRPSLALSPYNVHRMLITAIVVAHKFNSDVFFNNARYSKVGGIPLAEMNQLELEMLFLVRFELKIDAEEIQRVGTWLMTRPLPSTTKLASSAVGRFSPLGVLTLFREDSIPPPQFSHPTPGLHPIHGAALSHSTSLPPLEYVMAGIPDGRLRSSPHHAHRNSLPSHPPHNPNGDMTATPSSMRTPRIPNGSPAYRSYPGCDLETNGMAVDDAAYRTHVVGVQPVVHQGNQFTQPVWRDNTLSPFSPISPTEQLFGNAVAQKRRRIQPVSVIHNVMEPTPAAATATTAPVGSRVSEAE